MTFSTDDGLTLTLPGCTFRFVFSILYYVKYPCNVIHDIVTNLCIVNNNNNNALFILHGCHVIIRYNVLHSYVMYMSCFLLLALPLYCFLYRLR